MSRVNLSDLLLPAMREGYAVAGLVALGWEEARAFVEAAEEENLPVILQAGPGFRKHMPLEAIASMFVRLAEDSNVPVAVHLDHAESAHECRRALQLGFTSVMYDGSALPLNQNIKNTSEVAKMAKEYSASCEGEVGRAGYSGGETPSPTDPEEASRFASETGVDALAVSVGNVHLETRPGDGIDRERIREIESRCGTPLVLHGSSGIAESVRRSLAAETNVCKFNVGTELRMAFGESLRRTLSENPDRFDRIEIMNDVGSLLRERACRIIRSLGKPRERMAA